MSSLKNNSEDHCSYDGDFRFFKNAFLQGLVSHKLPDEVLEKLQDPNALLEQIELHKDSNSTTAGAIQVKDQKYFLKRYNNKDLTRKLKNSVRKTRPFKVLKITQAVNKSGVFAPEVFAALNHRRGLLIESSYLLSSYLENATTASQMLDKFIDEDSFEKFNEKLCNAFIKIHDAGIVHRDAKLSNILILNCNSDSFDIGLLDFDGSRDYSEKLSHKERVRDMARIISSFFLTGKSQGLPVKPLDKLIDVFAAKYADISGIELQGERLTRRTKYLSTRVRKK
jgi:tRNA A-37 threonylcarbamoyl transferase component Bud32